MIDFQKWRNSLELKTIRESEPLLLEARANGNDDTKMLASSALLLLSADAHMDALYGIALARTKELHRLKWIYGVCVGVMLTCSVVGALL